MALIIRIDVDRPYGKHPAPRHVLSRLSSDAYLPRMEAFGYLKELKLMLQILNERHASSYVFFRRCTLPSEPVFKLLDQGRHEIGLHLENSRSFETFLKEKRYLDRYIGKNVMAISKHGSGGKKYGYNHYAPYEPEKYIGWARRLSMRVFFGNLEDPAVNPVIDNEGFLVYPAAFWLEPHWRNTKKLTVDWLLSCATKSDVVLLVHPENVLQSAELLEDFKRITANLPTKIIDRNCP